MCQVFFHFFEKDVTTIGKQDNDNTLKRMCHLGVNFPKQVLLSWCYQRSLFCLSVYFLEGGCNHKSLSTQFHLTLPSDASSVGRVVFNNYLFMSYISFILPLNIRQKANTSQVFFSKKIK